MWGNIALWDSGGGGSEGGRRERETESECLRKNTNSYQHIATFLPPIPPAHTYPPPLPGPSSRGFVEMKQVFRSELVTECTHSCTQLDFLLWALLLVLPFVTSIPAVCIFLCVTKNRWTENDTIESCFFPSFCSKNATLHLNVCRVVSVNQILISTN